MNIKPIKKFVAVVRIKNELVTSSGILLTKSVDTIDKCRVIAIGPEVNGININDKLLIDWNKANTFIIDNIPVYLINYDNIIGVFED